MLWGSNRRSNIAERCRYRYVGARRSFTLAVRMSGVPSQGDWKIPCADREQFCVGCVLCLAGAIQAVQLRSRRQEACTLPTCLLVIHNVLYHYHSAPCSRAMAAVAVLGNPQEGSRARYRGASWVITSTGNASRALPLPTYPNLPTQTSSTRPLSRRP